LRENLRKNKGLGIFKNVWRSPRFFILDTPGNCGYNVATYTISKPVQESLRMENKVGVRELRDHASKIVRAVSEEMAEYIVTVNGKPVAVLRPYTEEDAREIARREIQAEMNRMRSTAEKVARSWTARENGTAIVEAQRR
jgi:prevent-host-death family protein